MIDLEKILSKYYKHLLFVIFILASAFRWWYLPAKAIFFSFDQARDAFIIQQILGGHLKILGPPVSGIPGLFHGVFYYYVIAPAYLLGHGSPVVVSYWFSFLNAATIFITFLLVFLLTKKYTPSLFAALIYACSFEATQYANLLTNASMAEWFVPIFYTGLFLWINKAWKWSPVLTGLGLGLAIQSEIAVSYNFIPLIICLLVFRKNIARRQLVLFVASFLFAISSMIISEIKFGFPGVSGLLYLFTSKDQIIKSIQFGDFVTHFLNLTGETFANTIFPLDNAFGGLIGFIFTAVAFKKFRMAKFLILYIFAYIFALPFGGWNMRHIMVGTTVGIAAITGIVIWKLGKKPAICFFAIALILSSNIYKILKENINGQTIFSLGSDLVLSKEIKVLDYVYQKANGKPFSISTLTSPLFINTTWSYLFNWYGQGKYGYLPYWVGRDQIDQLGDDLQSAPDGISEHFFISESVYGIPELYVIYAKGDQDAMSTLVEEKKFGEIVVQERRSKK